MWLDVLSQFFFSGSLPLCWLIMSTEPPATETTHTKVNHLVIDTNAIINGMTLKDTADFFYTCPEVMSEVRSAHSREYLTRLPFEIKVENPTEEALKAGK